MEGRIRSKLGTRPHAYPMVVMALGGTWERGRFALFTYNLFIPEPSISVSPRRRIWHLNTQTEWNCAWTYPRTPCKSKFLPLLEGERVHLWGLQGGLLRRTTPMPLSQRETTLCLILIHDRKKMNPSAWTHQTLRPPLRQAAHSNRTPKLADQSV